MASWHVLDLGDAMLAAADLAHLQDRFDRIWRKCGCPSDMALYVQHISEGRLQCELLVYFTPAASAVAEDMGAEPCAPPEMEGLERSSGAGS